MQNVPADQQSPSDQETSTDSVWRQRPDKVREPLLAESVVAVSAPALAIAALDGQILETDHWGYTTAHGHYLQDQRILSRSELTVNGERPEYLGYRLVDATSSKHVCLVRTREDPTPDAVILVERRHRAGRGETITVVNNDSRDRELTILLSVQADLADISEVRRGAPAGHAEITVEDSLLRWLDRENGTVVTLRAQPDPDIEADGIAGAMLRWTVSVPSGERREFAIELETTLSPSAHHAVQAVKEPLSFTRPGPTGDRRLDAVVQHGIDDLQALLLASANAPSQVFTAAGAPWYLTLFGRDSLWTARLMLPVDPRGELAFGTLHALAALQGTKQDVTTDEQPGKILHELRRRTTTHQQGQVLPPVYYGSMDSTPLFVLLLVDAFRTTGDADRARALLPAARKALDWMREQTEADGSGGFIRHTASHTGALFNHGWKDSFDAIVNMRGERASGRIALSEVQAYAFEAANGFAALLREVAGATAEAEAQEWEKWAAELRERFMACFEVPREEIESYFAIALDGEGVVVDGLTSNMGHLLSSGILNFEQSARVARHLVSDRLFSGWGLRTRSSKHPHFSKMSYHGGAVWAHDTAIAIRGLADVATRAHAEGHPAASKECAEAARTLADGLLAAAQTFGYRLPELFSGGQFEPGDLAPLPFPTSCKPQAWSAAAGVAVWDALQRIRTL